MTKDYPWGKGTIKEAYDATANDSDKTILTVPTGKKVVVESVYVSYTSTATVGNRLIVVLITDGTNTIYRASPTAFVTASQTATLGFAIGNSATAAFAPAVIQCNLPELVLNAASVIRVYDVNAVDAAADDMTVSAHYREYDA